jgi:hypothetical protein
MSEPLVFIHLSDIHFNKKWMDHYDLDRDLRSQIEKDVVRMQPKFTSTKGILVSGDVAFGGKEEEYDEARSWLKILCQLARCREQDVWCVPGNHDVDRTVYEGSPVLQDLHNTLRPVDSECIGEIDELIPRYLRDSLAGPLLFKPLEKYNDFAALFSCPSHPNPLCWHDDLELNDGSILRLYGINSTLVSDLTDDIHTRRMIVGTIQARPEEVDGVTYLAMCHHPPDWLLDQDNFVNSMNSRVKLQLYGHKHIQRVDQINNCLRIGSGAVHPSRREKNWLPRYNWLKLSVRRTKKDRVLDVEVHPRHWYEPDTRFIADTAACDAAESKVYSLNLAEWTAPAALAPLAPVPISNAGGVSTGEAVMVNTDHADAARTLTYRFLDLSHVTRIEIAQELGLYRNEDEGVRDPELLERIFRRANEAKLLAKLWNLVERQHGDNLDNTNPYEGR